MAVCTLTSTAPLKEIYNTVMEILHEKTIPNSNLKSITNKIFIVEQNHNIFIVISFSTLV